MHSNKENLHTHSCCVPSFLHVGGSNQVSMHNHLIQEKVGQRVVGHSSFGRHPVAKDANVAQSRRDETRLVVWLVGPTPAG